MKWLPENDGIDHINIYSKARTCLGWMLSNWSPYSVKMEEGRFQCVEGYWFYLSTRDPRFFDANGAEAKFLGSKLKKNRIVVPDFDEKIKNALWQKAHHQEIKEALFHSKLPFTHYYVYADRPIAAGFEWITEEWEEIRRVFKEIGLGTRADRINK